MNHTPAITLVFAVAVAALAVGRAALERRPAWRRVFAFLGGVEVAAITLMLATLIALGGIQIVLRNVAHTGLLWANPLMRHLVLWLGCLGATLATARMRHINIDVFSRALPERFRAVRDVVVYAATAVASFLLGLAALRLVVDEKAFGDTAFLGLGTWTLQTVLPVSFFLIAYRSLVNMLLGRRPKLPAEGVEA